MFKQYEPHRHGIPRDNTRPNLGGEVALGIASENFPYQSFQFMMEEEFSKLPVGKLVNDSAVDGQFSFSKHSHVSLRDEPFIIP